MSLLYDIFEDVNRFVLQPGIGDIDAIILLSPSKNMIHFELSGDEFHNVVEKWKELGWQEIGYVKKRDVIVEVKINIDGREFINRMIIQMGGYLVNFQ